MKPEPTSARPSPWRHYSGILVYTVPSGMVECVRQLERMSGVEVHHTDPGTGRIVAVLESDRFGDQERLLRRVQGTSRVLLAELVYYHRDEAPADDVARPPGDLAIERTGT